MEGSRTTSAQPTTGGAGGGGRGGGGDASGAANSLCLSRRCRRGRDDGVHMVAAGPRGRHVLAELPPQVLMLPRVQVAPDVLEHLGGAAVQRQLALVK
jgi:hypothetical protein